MQKYLKHLEISSKVHDYQVFLPLSLNLDEADLVIVDQNVMDLYPLLFNENSVSIIALEADKNLSSVSGIMSIFQSRSIRRNSKVTFVGGGVIQDLATFATSIYMRGISWRYIPTTFQAMIDSCVGGKSSLNFNSTKNLLGNYYPPHEVIIWPEFLQSLNNEHLICGLIEGLKICVASQPNDFISYLELTKSCLNLKFTNTELAEIIFHTLSAKKAIIEVDEFDIGIRKLLNYGHTFGHAIESASDYRVPHGVAVGIGILVAHEFSRSKGILEDNQSQTEEVVLHLLKSMHSQTRDILERVDMNKVVTDLELDKKAQNKLYTFILPVIGEKLEVRSFEITLQQKNDILSALRNVFLKVSNG